MANTFWITDETSLKDEGSLTRTLNETDDTSVINVSAGLLKDLLQELTSLRNAEIRNEDDHWNTV